MNKSTKFAEGEASLRLYQKYTKELTKKFITKEEDLKAKNDKQSEE